MTGNLTAITLSLGKHRKDTNWIRKTMTWADLITRLSKTHRTAEKYDEYLRAPKSRQDEIKDIGGFVGGVLDGGRRLKRSVLYRTLLTLDIDNVPEGRTAAQVWAAFCRIYDFAAVCYSTHKHSPTRPRLRIVAYFDRNVAVDEYQAIARYIAGSLQIDYFDPTTFQSERLMYYPSTSKDGDFFYAAQDGEALEADAILAEYGDGREGPGTGWRDIHRWPTCRREKAAVHTSQKLAGNPLEKRGLIGIFCRSYTIAEAIARFLPGIYEAADGDLPGSGSAAAGEAGSIGRYTYVPGSTAGGMLTYAVDGPDGQPVEAFAYSHHGTDPAGGRLCNAFDLVRLHKFGHLDHKHKGGDASGGVDFDDPEAGAVQDVTKLPSYKEMIEYAGADDRVRIRVVQERMAATQEAFKDFVTLDIIEEAEAITQTQEASQQPAAEERQVSDRSLGEPGKAVQARAAEVVDPGAGGEAGVGNADWADQLECDKKGNPKSTIYNIFWILQHDPELVGRFQRDDFRGQDYLLGKVPWRRVTEQTKWITDNDVANLRGYLEKKYGITGNSKIEDGFEMMLTRNTIHPVRSYLRGLVWDGVPRVETMLIKYLGAEDTPYVRTVTRKWMAAAVTRIMRPGAKFDNLLVLVGEEGTYKSLLADKLGGEWYSDNIHTVQGKEGSEQLQGWWVMEMAELAAVRKAEHIATLAFISRRVDSYRPAYGRRTAIRPRQCIFYGTTNEDAFLKNAAGNRRFWPIQVGVVTPELWVPGITKDDIGQLWAEAMQLFRDGESLYLDKTMTAVAKQVREDYTEQDVRIEDVKKYLKMEVPENWYDMTLVERKDFINGTSIFSAAGENDDIKGKKFKRDRICIKEIWEELFRGDLKTYDQRTANAISAMMNSLKDWKRASTVRIEGRGITRGWLKI